MRERAEADTLLDEATVCELHRRVVLHSKPDIAGQYSQFPRRIAGSAVILPNAAKVPHLMKEFGEHLRDAPNTPEGAFDAHVRLVEIHPFADGNGRTARLLMNLMLIRGGYPPVAVRPEDRERYLNTLEHASLKHDRTPFQAFMHERLEATMSDYIALFDEAIEAQRQRAFAEHRQNQGRGY